MRFQTLSLLALTVMLSACGTSTLTLNSYDGSKTVDLNVEVADTAKEREKGLMGRKSLDENTGMFFAFKDPQIMQFWMKNTLIPLEILFFDAEGNFVNAATMEPCAADPCPRYSSAALAQYALEVSPGFREAKEIGTGWKLDMDQVKNIANPK